MQRKKVLWLVSWYPNKNDRFDGDFIQRHARAAAIFHDVHVIFVTDTDDANGVEEEWNYATGLTEQFIYFPKASGILAKLRKQWLWRNLFQKAVDRFIQKNGLPDVVHVHVPWKAGLIAIWMKKKYVTDFIVTEHWGIYNDVVEDNFSGKSALTRSLVKKIFREAGSFLSVSRFLAEGVKMITGKAADAIIPNVVDTSLFFYKTEKYSKFSFIHVSNMVPLKNVKGILDAFQTVMKKTGAGIQLILVGNRNDEHVKYAEYLGLLNSSVFFRGEISYREVAEEMQRSHVFLLNSLMENSPCVIGEALCCGLPVVATNVGGIPELVNASNSILIDRQQVDALAAAMEKLWRDYDKFNGKDIASAAASRFGYAAVAKMFNDCYQNFHAVHRERS